MSKASSISRKKWAELLTQISWVDASFLGFLLLFHMCASYTPIYQLTVPPQILRELMMQCRHGLLSMILKTLHLKKKKKRRCISKLSTSVGTAQCQCVGVTYTTVMCAVYWSEPSHWGLGQGSESLSYPTRLIIMGALFLAPEAILKPLKSENSGIFIHLCESFKGAEMKQILLVHFEKLTPAVVLYTWWLTVLDWSRPRMNLWAWLPLHTLCLQTLEFPTFLELMWFGQAQE